MKQFSDSISFRKFCFKTIECYFASSSMLPAIFKKLVNEEETLKSKLIKSTLGSFGLRIVAIVLKFLINLFLARVSGAEGLGAYTFAITVTSLIGVPTSLGFPQLAVRELSAYEAKQEISKLKGFIRQSRVTLLISSVLVSISCILIAQYTISTPILRQAFRISVVSLPFLVFRNLNQSKVHGLGKVISSQVPENLVFPISLISLIILNISIFKAQITIERIIVIHIFSVFISFVVSQLLLQKNLPIIVRNTIPEYNLKKYFLSALPFIFFGGLYIVNSQLDTVMLGSLKGPGEVGIYSVANRLASLMVFVLVSSNSSLAPNISKLSSLGELENLQRIITKSTRMVFFSSLIIFLVLILSGKFLVGVFGKEFTPGYSALLILSFGQLANSAVGPVNVILNMTGNEGYSMKSLAASGLINILGNALLIPLYGVNGAAIATAFSMIVWNFLGTIFVIKKVKINPTFLCIS